MAIRINFCLGLILIVLSCRSCHSKSFYVDYEEGIEDPSEFYSNLLPNSKSQDESMSMTVPFLPTNQDQDKSGQSSSVGLGAAVKRTQPEIIPDGSEFDPNSNANLANSNNNEIWLSSKNNGDNSWNGKDGENKKSQIGRLGIKNGSLAGANNNGFKANSRAIRRYRYRGSGGYAPGWNNMKNSNAQRYLSAPSPSVFSYSSGYHNSNYGEGNGKSDSSGFSKRQSILYRQCFFNPISCFRK